MSPPVLFWRRTDVEGVERLVLDVADDGRIEASATVLCTDAGGFRLEHSWRLDRQWRALAVTVERWNAQGHQRLTLTRDGSGWCVDGELRPDLDGCEEPDLSVTPFCNTFPIRRLADTPGAILTLDTAYIDGVAMTVARSRQRYIRQGPGRVRYVDLGLALGFEADLVVDERGLVRHYEHLFERIDPTG